MTTTTTGQAGRWRGGRPDRAPRSPRPRGRVVPQRPRSALEAGAALHQALEHAAAVLADPGLLDPHGCSPDKVQYTYGRVRERLRAYQQQRQANQLAHLLDGEGGRTADRLNVPVAVQAATQILTLLYRITRDEQLVRQYGRYPQRTWERIYTASSDRPSPRGAVVANQSHDMIVPLSDVDIWTLDHLISGLTRPLRETKDLLGQGGQGPRSGFVDDDRRPPVFRERDQRARA